MMAEREGKGQDADRKIKVNLHQSSGNALQALEHFKASLVAAGFTKSADAYVKMAETLVGQRLYAADLDDPALEMRFHELAECAGEIDQILAPFIGAMRKIAALQAMVPDPPPDGAGSAKPNGHTEAAPSIVAILKAAPRGLSKTALRGKTGLSTKALQAELDRLRGKGLIKPQGTNSRVRWVAVTPK